MANIASQEKRIARAERERSEHRRRTSQVKPWFRRLEAQRRAVRASVRKLAALAARESG